MRPFVLFRLFGVAALPAAFVFTIAIVAQAPQNAEAGAPPAARTFPAPTNLKALPKNLTGEQVDAIMQQWKAGLGIQCGSCHAEDREKLDPEGRPMLDFASDSKPMKLVARAMYTLTEDVNTRYLSKIDSSGVPVTCGTCHRGHLGPEPFVIAPQGKGNLPAN